MMQNFTFSSQNWLCYINSTLYVKII